MYASPSWDAASSTMSLAQPQDRCVEDIVRRMWRGRVKSVRQKRTNATHMAYHVTLHNTSTL